MAEIVAKRLVEHLERAGFVAMKTAPVGGHSTFKGVGNGPFVSRQWLPRLKSRESSSDTFHPSLGAKRISEA